MGLDRLVLFNNQWYWLASSFPRHRETTKTIYFWFDCDHGDSPDSNPWQNDWGLVMEELKPGRELDALVAEKVMGIDLKKICPFENSRDNDGCFECDDCGYSTYNWSYMDHHITPKRYSTDISAALEVVEKLKDMGKEISMSHTKSWNDEWVVSAERCGGNEWEYGIGSDSLPHAICLAALKAVE